MDDKNLKALNTLCTKLAQVFNDFYIMKNGYILSNNLDSPYLIKIDDCYVDLFSKLIGDFDIVHILDMRAFKKILSVNEDLSLTKSFYKIITLPSQKKEIVSILSKYTDDIKKIDTWLPFKLSDDKDDNEKLINDLFKKNILVNFLPKDNEKGPFIIFSKSLLPLITEKNYTDVEYASFKKMDSLYVIIFQVSLPLFHMYMIHHYIPFL